MLSRVMSIMEGKASPVSCSTSFSCHHILSHHDELTLEPGLDVSKLELRLDTLS